MTRLLLLMATSCALPAAEPPAAEPPTAEPPTEPAMITDEQCLAKGGQVITEQTYAHLDRRHREDDAPRQPFRVCHVPSPKNGAACRDDADCEGGRCFCDSPLNRPNPQRFPELAALDGTQGTGRCSDEPVPSGEWWCLVVGGKVVLNGIIVD